MDPRVFFLLNSGTVNFQHLFKTLPLKRNGAVPYYFLLRHHFKTPIMFLSLIEFNSPTKYMEFFQYINCCRLDKLPKHIYASNNKSLSNHYQVDQV